jgi:hypothetical protein
MSINAFLSMRQRTIFFVALITSFLKSGKSRRNDSYSWIPLLRPLSKLTAN